jgi:hypothetical protein
MIAFILKGRKKGQENPMNSQPFILPQPQPNSKFFGWGNDIAGVVREFGELVT